MHGCVVQSLHVVVIETLGRRRLCLPFQSSSPPTKLALGGGILNTSVGVVSRFAYTWSKLRGGTGSLEGKLVRGASSVGLLALLPAPRLHVWLAADSDEMKLNIPLVSCMRGRKNFALTPTGATALKCL